MAISYTKLVNFFIISVLCYYTSTHPRFTDICISKQTMINQTKWHQLLLLDTDDEVVESRVATYDELHFYIIFNLTLSICGPLVVGFGWMSKQSLSFTFFNQKRSEAVDSTITWVITIVVLLAMLRVEFLLEMQFFFSKKFTGGRYLYCLFVLIVGIALSKLPPVINVLIAKWMKVPADASNCYGVVECGSPSSSDTNDNLRIVQEYDDLSCQSKRRVYGQQVVMAFCNTFLAVFVPVFAYYPEFVSNGEVGLSAQLLEKYVLTIQVSVNEATFFLWSAILGSQLLALSNEIIVTKVLAKNMSNSCVSKLLTRLTGKQEGNELECLVGFHYIFVL